MKLKDNSTQEIDTALYQLEQRLKSNVRLTDVENSNASTAKINAVDKKLTEEIKDRQSADGKLQDNINKEIADRQEADAAIENAKQDKLIAGYNIQINGNIISATSTEYMAEAPVKVTDGKISLDTVPIIKGGTGVTTQEDINKAFVSNLDFGESDVTDGTEFVSSYASDNGFAERSEGALNKPYKRQFVKVWNYIRDKISSVLGLTKDNYGGKAATAGNADTVDNYHASQLWRSDGATWNPNANVSLNAAANGDEWSFDIHRNGHTGCYWHVWDSEYGPLLIVNADDGKVSAPNGFVGNLSGKADTAGTADKTVNDIPIDIPYVRESGQYVIPLGNIPQPGSGEYNSPYNWDIVGFFSIIRPSGHAGVHTTFAAGHGYSHGFTTYAFLDEDNFTESGSVGSSIKAFQYNGNWWLGLWITTQWQGFYSKMTVTYSRGLPATPTCILYNSDSGGVANEEIYNSIQDIPSWWWRKRTIYNPTTFTQGIKAPSKMVIPIGAPSSLEDGCIWIER